MVKDVITRICSVVRYVRSSPSKAKVIARSSMLVKVSCKDWANARVLDVCLKQFYEATRRLSGSLYATANMHFHEILGVLSSLLEWKNSSNPDLRNMGSQMREKFDKYCGELGKTNVMILVAVVLDPGYKLRASNISVDIEQFLEDVQRYEEELEDNGPSGIEEVGNN
ncbi:hypothetical protein V6N11_081295 [Hibiscus sabdariffa]|uniref:hAT-like transposase RNase-H fold domain-containing protein n=1 Tax=Hibiscus sabdariffa TaxID=183260 RepID=A0ABR2QJI2_9ROSI